MRLYYNEIFLRFGIRIISAKKITKVIFFIFFLKNIFHDLLFIIIRFLESLRGYLWSTQAPDGGRVDGAEDAVRALQSMADLAEGEDELMLSARLHDNAK